MNIPALGTVLGVWAHPDDEAYLSSGLMAMARNAGQRVVVVTATLGEHGTDDPIACPPHRLIRVRHCELTRALSAVGVEEHHLLGYQDGDCPSVPVDEAAGRIARFIDDVDPDTIVTFGPDGMTGHPDHQAVSHWVDVAWEAVGTRARVLHATVTDAFVERFAPLHERLGLFPPGLPPRTPEDELALHLRLDGDVLDRKLAALRAHRSQTASLESSVGPATYREWWSTESFVDAAAA